MFHILVIAPTDQVFIGPVPSRFEAETHAITIRAVAGHDAYVLSPDEYAENVAAFGPLPVQSE